jgi:FixJ family two-component response regulator
MITDEQAKLMIKIKRKESKIKHYESIEETLTDEEREVLYRVYVKEQPYWKIVNDMGFSIRTAKRRRETGLDKLCIGLFGEND